MHPPATSIRATPKFSRQHRISRLPNIDLSEQNGRVVCSLIGSGSSYKSCVPLRVCQGSVPIDSLAVGLNCVLAFVEQSGFVNTQSTATEDALRRAVDTTPAFIHTARPDGFLDYFNRGWLDFLGKSLENVCGWRWTESVHPEDVATLVQKWHAALASGEPLEVEARVRRADGSYR